MRREKTLSGWLRDGLTTTSRKLVTGGVFKRFRISARTTIQEIDFTNRARFIVSSGEAGRDRGRGFYRGRVLPLFSPGGTIKSFKLKQVFQAIYGKGYQHGVKVDRAAEYGRFYQTDTDVPLGISHGTLKGLRVGESFAVNHLKLRFQDPVLLWDDITNAETFDKSEE